MQPRPVHAATGLPHADYTAACLPKARGACQLTDQSLLQVLGIVGALDPHTHKVNQANIQGEGKLEQEGVRPQRQPDPTTGIGIGVGAATTLGKHLHS